MTKPTVAHVVDEKKRGLQYDKETDGISSQKAADLVQNKVEKEMKEEK